MGMMYHAVFTDIAVTALQDLFEVLSPADNVIVIHSWEILQTSDVGDAAEELIRLETVRGVGTVTSGSGGGTVTTQPMQDGFAATGATVERNNTTRMAVGTGTLETLEYFGWNVRIPLEKVYTPEARPVITPSNRWTLSLPANPADSLTMSGSLVYEEWGG